MTFLKKLGGLVAKALSVWYGFSGALGAVDPQAAGVIQHIDSEIGLIAQEIVRVEAIGQALSLAGPDKSKAAAPLIGQLILQSPFMIGKKIKDEALWLKGCGEIGGGFADCLNALDDNSVKVEDKA